MRDRDLISFYIDKETGKLEITGEIIVLVDTEIDIKNFKNINIDSLIKRYRKYSEVYNYDGEFTEILEDNIITILNEIEKEKRDLEE